MSRHAFIATLRTELGVTKTQAVRIQEAVENIFMTDMRESGVMLHWPGFAFVKAKPRNGFSRKGTLNGKPVSVTIRAKNVLKVVSVGTRVDAILNP